MLAAVLAMTAMFVAMAFTSIAGQSHEIEAEEETGIVTLRTVVASESETEEETETEPESETENEAAAWSRDWGADDEAILLQIAMAEAESEGVEGKALVMMVVLNRVWSDDFPDSIEAVVTQEGQFSTVTEGGRYYTVTPDEECYEAMELIYSGWDESQGALYFESCTGGSWHEANLTYLFQYGNHRFYK